MSAGHEKSPIDPEQNDHKPTKRQSTLDESSTIDVPTTKKQKIGTDIAEEVKKEEDPKAINETVAVDKDRFDVEEKNVTIQKGLIYFFFRPRVDHEKIKTPVDAQRSYIVLRPLPQGAVLESKTKLEDQTAHLLELPKKILPQEGEKFMAFVANGRASITDLESHLSASSYTTKTRGERTTPAARPSGQGVYCLADIKSSTHLIYKLTTPNSLGEVQDAFGILNEGSFVVSAKNPEKNSGGNQLPGNANFPQSLQKTFGTRSWLPLTPELLTYNDTGLLFIGSGAHSLETDTANEDLTRLSHEDEARESLKLIFKDLGLSLKKHESKPLLGEFA